MELKPPIEEVANGYLMHYGKGHLDGGHSGRYPWGSGDSPYQHAQDFMTRVNFLKKQGFSETEIAESMGMLNEFKKPSSTKLRAAYAIAKDEVRMENVKRCKELQAQGLSLQKIANEIGKPEGTVRSLLDEEAAARTNVAKNTAEFLKQMVKEKGPIDIGASIESELGISREKFNQAVEMLRYEGYEVYGRSVAQVNNPGKRTTLKVLFPPGSEHKEIYDLDKIATITDYKAIDNGKEETFKKGFVYPESLDSKRLQIRYDEDGGTQRDGLIELRRGVQDLDLGKSNYAQVRIMVDGKYYLKGMAVYADDLPDGVDVRFNSNKSKEVGMAGALKKIKEDPDNPFGSLIKENGGQSYYIDEKDGKEKLSLINKRAEEGDWGAWKDHLSSQFLAKQGMPLIKKQLQLTQYDKQSEFDEIMKITNPTVKRNLLASFADDCDASAVHLKAAALPRQKYQVLLPMPELNEKEIYAPNYKNGEQVALVRYPFGGTFECPIVTVNNNSKRGIQMMGKTPMDAIGLHPKVAEQMSGADFDGDTALVIPISNRAKIASRDKLPGLDGFDPKMEYGGKEEGTFKPMKNTQTEMGKVSNLIMDMTLKGADDDELARAVRHSMVVIDAEKHHLDYKQSEKDNGIKELKAKYQGEYDSDGNYHEGASTLITRAKSKEVVIKRKGSPIIDPETGKVSYKEVIEEYTDKNGKTKIRTQESTKMAETDDAHTLVSKKYETPQELAYADHANFMKNLANQARKEMLATPKLAYSPSAKVEYASEVESLNNKLRIAESNRPKERRAQILANSAIAAKKEEYPNMTKSELKKISQQALTKARAAVGAKRTPVEITDKEWEAIQKGAISDNKLNSIMRYADIDKVRQLATPRSIMKLTPSKISRLKLMAESGNYTNMDIAQALGISSSTVNKYLKGDVA